jgi:hypothetical protein
MYRDMVGCSLKNAKLVIDKALDGDSDTEEADLEADLVDESAARG